jgi:hypothetical protein
MLVFGGKGDFNFGPYGQPGGGYSYGCRHPFANAGGDVQTECSSPTRTPVALDGTGSWDPDSTLGTQDDIVSYEWFRRYGSPDAELLATGVAPSVDLPMGTSEITLKVTDAEGGVSLDTVEADVVDTTPPVLHCAAEVAAECTAPSGAFVSLVASTSDACSDTVDVQNDRTGTGSDASGIYPLGSIPVTFTASDPSGNSSQCLAEVAVRDTTPPQITSAVTPALLWPPNHRMVDVGASVVATDACSTPAVILTSVTSSEPDDAPGGGDGNTTSDIQGVQPGTASFGFQLRAERDAAGEGRTYKVTYAAIDSSGNQSSTSSIVFVPHDQNGTSEPLFISAQYGASGTFLQWPPVQGATSYRAIRGSVSSLQGSGEFIDLGTVACIQAGSPSTDTQAEPDAEIPPVGEAFFYLVSYNDGQDSGYGSDTATKPRVKTGGGCE